MSTPPPPLLPDRTCGVPWKCHNYSTFHLCPLLPLQLLLVPPVMPSLTLPHLSWLPSSECLRHLWTYFFYEGLPIVDVITVAKVGNREARTDTEKRISSRVWGIKCLCCITYGNYKSTDLIGSSRWISKIYPSQSSNLLNGVLYIVDLVLHIFFFTFHPAVYPRKLILRDCINGLLCLLGSRWICQ